MVKLLITILNVQILLLYKDTTFNNCKCVLSENLFIIVIYTKFLN